MGFVDVQVNGYAGVSFNRDLLTEAKVRFVVERLHADGVRAILGTVVTDEVPMMAQRLARFRELIDRDPARRRTIPAFHIEGPCISPVEGYRGAHRTNAIRPATLDAIEPLIEAAGGPERVAMFTLAPEVDAGLRCTRWLAEQGIIVCAGHTDAPMTCLLEAVDAGLQFVTHLGNGTANLMHRHDNIIHRVLSIDQLKYSIIPDGQHLPWFFARNLIRWAGLDRIVITTDCSEAAGADADYVPPEGLALDTSGEVPVMRLKGTPYLAGSAVTMRQCYDVSVRQIGLTEEQAQAVCSDHPAALIGPWLDRAATV